MALTAEMIGLATLAVSPVRGDMGVVSCGWYKKNIRIPNSIGPSYFLLILAGLEKPSTSGVLLAYMSCARSVLTSAAAFTP